MRVEPLMRAAIAILVLGACSSGAKPPTVAPAPPPAPSQPADSPYAALDLDFETVVDGHPKAWAAAQDKAQWIAVTDQVHGGRYSLRIEPQKDDFVAAATSTDAAPFKGKHVRLRGWIRTQLLGGSAALWVRADSDGNSVIDNMGTAAPSGTTPWTAASVEIDVPADAKVILFGAFVQAKGTAWFDDLSLEVTVPEPPHPIALSGTVVTADGKPAAGAEVALVGASIEHHLTADANGAWKLATTSGKWGLSASTPAATGFIDGVSYLKDTTGLKLVVTGGVAVHGKLTTKPLAGTFVAISVVSSHDADLFAVPVASDGTFVTQVPKTPSVVAQLIDNGIGHVSSPVTGDRVDLLMPSAVLAPPAPEVDEWVKAHAFPLATVEAGHGFDDLAPFAKLIGKAHVIAFGEATHGTREFFQMKHRMLEYLVTKLGVTVFAIEANQPECRAIDDYVLSGKGDAKTALAGIYFWTWNTEEVLAMIEWMRAYNANPAHLNKVHFTGFDMQTSNVAHANVIAYLEEVGADVKLAEPIAVLGNTDSFKAVPKLAADERAKILAGLAAVAKLFDTNKTAWRAKHTTTTFDDARHDVTVMQQAFLLYTTPEGGPFNIRDQSMADNIGWLREQWGKSMRMMVWAHNGHIAKPDISVGAMGSHLRLRYYRDYVNIGFVFSDGGFQAIDGSKGSEGRLGTLGPITVGPVAESDGTTPFLHTGKPLLALDLHAVPNEGAVHDWFASPHPYREIGAAYFSEKSMLQPMSLTSLYDAVIFVAHTTRARPITTTKVTR